MKKKLLVALALVAIATAIVVFRPTIRTWLLAAASWAETSPELAWPIYIVVFALAIVLMLPGWVFMVAAGYLFGMVNGGVLAFVANLLGSVAAFYVARNFARDWVKEKIDRSPRFSGFDERADPFREFIEEGETRLDVHLRPDFARQNERTFRKAGLAFGARCESAKAI